MTKGEEERNNFLKEINLKKKITQIIKLGKQKEYLSSILLMLQLQQKYGINRA